jgi:hypothetical protein
MTLTQPCPPCIPLPAGKQAVDYFHTQCPALEGLKDGGNEAEWIVDLTTQADRQGRAGDFAATYANSEFKAAADKQIEQQLAAHSDLGAPPWRCCLCCLRQRSLLCLLWSTQVPVLTLPSLSAAVPLSPADDETRADLAVKRETVTPSWWGLKTLLKVRGHCLAST